MRTLKRLSVTVDLPFDVVLRGPQFRRFASVLGTPDALQRKLYLFDPLAVAFAVSNLAAKFDEFGPQTGHVLVWFAHRVLLEGSAALQP